MNDKIRLLSLLLLLATTSASAIAEDIVDITSRFTGKWNQSESVIHNSDGTITYKSKKWGGLSYWVNSDWTSYKSLTFEFSEAAPCLVQAIISYDGDQWRSNSRDAGVTEVSIDLDSSLRSHVMQVALQTDTEATISVKRIYLTKEPVAATETIVINEQLEFAMPSSADAEGGSLIINELMQSNIDAALDALNDFPDSWVELYNNGTGNVNLGNYSLGTLADGSDKWPLPSGTIAPGAYVVLCCDKVGNGLHTPFRIDSGKGASVYLFKNGSVQDLVAGLKKQPAPNIAYGRTTDGSSEWGYQQRATPGSANCGQTATTLLGSPVFSEPGRVFTDASSFQLTLSLPQGAPDGAVIRYTTDGSEPVVSSTPYTDPINIDNTTTVRAKLFCDGYLTARATTHSYIFMGREQTLPLVSIVTNQQYLTGSDLGILTHNSDKERNDWRRPINFELFESSGQPSVLNQLCETRVQGGATRNNPLKSLAVYANKRFGTKRLTYEFFPEQRQGVTDFKSVLLRNAGNDFSYLYMRDAIIQSNMGKHTDLDWQAWRPAILYLNGVYKGMVHIRERSNEDNIYTNFDGLEDIDMIENWHELKEGTLDNYNSFKQFYSEPGHSREEYEQLMDCTEFLNLMVANLYYANVDFPGNNFMMWRPRAAGGRWRFVMKDADFGMGLYRLTASYKVLNWLYDFKYDSNRAWANTPEATLLFRLMMENEDLRNEFVDRAAVYMGDFLNQRGTCEVWDKMWDVVKSEFAYHRMLYPVSWPNHDEETEWTRLWLHDRDNAFYNNLSEFYNLGTPLLMTIDSQSTDGTTTGDVISFNGVPLSEGVFSGQYFAGRRVTLSGSGADGGETAVKGWRLTTYVGGKPSTTESQGAELSFVMPASGSVEVVALLNPTGIDSTQGAPSQWRWQIVGGELHLSGLAAGACVALYDVSGRLLSRHIAEGSSIALPLPAGKVFIVKSMGRSVKVVF